MTRDELLQAKSTRPSTVANAFSCPHCQTFARQNWHQARGFGVADGRPPALRPKAILAQGKNVEDFWFAYCDHCGGFSAWYKGRIVFPDLGSGPRANKDLPDDIREDYEEARRIADRSPRGAAALLRLCVQKLCTYLGEPGKNVNNDIASLVKKGLPVQVQQALDIVRVTGNDAVHPGLIDLKDDRETVERLFELLNLVAQAMITQPKAVAEMYSKLPQSKRDQITRRDGKA